MKLGLGDNLDFLILVVFWVDLGIKNLDVGINWVGGVMGVGRGYCIKIEFGLKGGESGEDCFNLYLVFLFIFSVWFLLVIVVYWEEGCLGKEI